MLTASCSPSSADARCAHGSSAFARLPLRRAAGLVVLTIVAFLLFSAIWAVVLNESKKDETARTAGRQRNGATAGAERAAHDGDRPDLRGDPVSRLHLRGALQMEGLAARGGHHRSAVRGGARRLGARRGSRSRSGCSGSCCACSYRRTGSLYPCIAVHSLNNSIAFGGLEGWGWRIPLLMVGSLAVIGALALIARRIGLISDPPMAGAVVPTAYDHP